MDPAQLVQNAKAVSAKSYRTLAADASVAASTMTRIEARATQPTIAVLERILGSCGFTLELTAVRTGTPARPRLRDVVVAWREQRTGGVELDWTRWRALLDELALHPEWVAEAIYPTPPPSGHAVVDALLAAVAEKLADDAGLARPAWTEAVPSLEVPFRPPARRRGDVPRQLEERGLIIDGASLFRPRESLGL